MFRSRVGPNVGVALLLATACTSVDVGSGTGSASGGTATTTVTSTVPTLPSIELNIQTSVGMLIVRDAEPGEEILAVDPADATVISRDLVEDNGTALLRGLPSGLIEVIVARDGQPAADGGSAQIPDDQPPPRSLYDDQTLRSGFNYVETRDGTLLSANVTLPPGSSDEDGPYPTLVEYSGYEPSNPEATDPARSILPLLGYALVQVNVRGTGCSGGSYDGFAEIERLDGYDIIETVDAQNWSDGVGMWGISYPGIMQLHVASTRPPGLDAIAPLSVIGSIEDTLFPGGIFNNGFGRTWTERVLQGAAARGQEWSEERIAAGDPVCASNQDLRIHNPDLVETALAEPFSTEVSRDRSPETFVDEIDVPVFLAGAWQDEQTGGAFPSMIDDFTNAPIVRANLYNGLHIDPLGPDVLVPLLEFYELYVARRSPAITPLLRLLVSAGTAAFFGEALPLPDSELADLPYTQARAAYEEQPSIRILYEVGAESPNLPVARFEDSFDSWPLDEVTPWRLYLSGGGSALEGRLADDPVATSGAVIVGFTTDPAEGAELTATGSAEIWGANPPWNWPAPTAGSAARFLTPISEQTTVLTGTASADLSIRLPDGEPDADLEVTLSDVAPDGSETFIQTGWLRLSRRALADDATELDPHISNRAEDIAPVESGAITPARVAILPSAHVLRPGHRLALTVDTPGASRPEWAFDVIPDPIRVEILTGSSLVLPVVPTTELAVDIPPSSPACGSLRGQPCRIPSQ